MAHRRRLPNVEQAEQGEAASAVFQFNTVAPANVSHCPALHPPPRYPDPFFRPTAPSTSAAQMPGSMIAARGSARTQAGHARRSATETAMEPARQRTGRTRPTGSSRSRTRWPESARACSVISGLVELRLPDLSGSLIGVEITYFSDAQLPRSMSLHRSLQNGMSGSSRETGFLQIGHFIHQRLSGPICGRATGRICTSSGHGRRVPRLGIHQLAHQVVIVRFRDAYASASAPAAARRRPKSLM